MYYVYILRSMKYPLKTYVGYTENIGARLNAHNRSDSPHTKKYKPWKLESFFSFSERKVATDFEVYLKSHSGRSFMKKRLI